MERRKWLEELFESAKQEAKDRPDWMKSLSKFEGYNRYPSTLTAPEQSEQSDVSAKEEDH